MRLLIVEDSERLCRTLALAFRKSGYAVDVAGNGDDGLRLAGVNEYDAMILDIMLPRVSGLDMLARLRQSGDKTHVLLLTARDAVDERVRGLRAGADDYLVKPFALEELLARVAALCRRSYGQKSSVLKIGNLTVDLHQKCARCGDSVIELAPREYQLLELLALRRGQVVSRREIEEHIYDDVAEPMSNVVSSAICVLRKKLEDGGGEPLVHTRRGAGYYLQETG